MAEVAPGALADGWRETARQLDADAEASSVYSVAVERASAADTFRQCATEIRERLAPAHAALVAERDNWRASAEVIEQGLADMRAERDMATQVTRTLTAENARLCATLEKIMGRTGLDDRAVILTMRADAREALEGGSGKPEATP